MNHQKQKHKHELLKKKTDASILKENATFKIDALHQYKVRCLYDAVNEVSDINMTKIQARNLFLALKSYIKDQRINNKLLVSFNKTQKFFIKDTKNNYSNGNKYQGYKTSFTLDEILIKWLNKINKNVHLLHLINQDTRSAKVVLRDMGIEDYFFIELPKDSKDIILNMMSKIIFIYKNKIYLTNETKTKRYRKYNTFQGMKSKYRQFTDAPYELDMSNSTLTMLYSLVYKEEILSQWFNKPDLKKIVSCLGHIGDYLVDQHGNSTHKRRLIAIEANRGKPSEEWITHEDVKTYITSFLYGASKSDIQTLDKYFYGAYYLRKIILDNYKYLDIFKDVKIPEYRNKIDTDGNHLDANDGFKIYVLGEYLENIARTVATKYLQSQGYKVREVHDAFYTDREVTDSDRATIMIIMREDYKLKIVFKYLNKNTVTYY